jgi:hypothetical protein
VHTPNLLSLKAEIRKKAASATAARGPFTLSLTNAS